MNIHSRMKWLVAFAVLACAASPAAADGPPATATATVRADVVDMNKAEAEGREVVRAVQTALARAEHQLNEARKHGDAVKVLALNEVVSQLGALLKGVEADQKTLSAAVKAGDHAAVSGRRGIMKVRVQRVNQLATEADQTLGNELGLVEGTITTLEQSGDLPQEDLPVLFPLLFAANLPQVGGPGGVPFPPPGPSSPTY